VLCQLAVHTSAAGVEPVVRRQLAGRSSVLADLERDGDRACFKPYDGVLLDGEVTARVVHGVGELDV